MRVVVDTSVFVSSFFGGYPRQVIDLWKRGEITLCLSRQIVDEYVRVLQSLGLEEEELEEILALFARGVHCLFTSKTPSLRIIGEDPADDKFFECAVALKAEYIVSGDAAVVRVEDYMGIKVTRPREFVRRRNEPHDPI